MLILFVFQNNNSSFCGCSITLYDELKKKKRNSVKKRKKKQCLVETFTKHLKLAFTLTEIKLLLLTF